MTDRPTRRSGSGTRRNNLEGTVSQMPNGKWQARTPRRPGQSVTTKVMASRTEAARWLEEQLDADRAARVPTALFDRLALIERDLARLGREFDVLRRDIMVAMDGQS